jgi:arginine/serine-rich splicing factor 4/5/6
MECDSENLDDLFRRPIIPGYDPIPVDRIDIKRGFGFVFLKDARSIEDKDRAERYVMELNGMYVLH